MSCFNRSFRNVEIEGDPIVEAIEELQEDVEELQVKTGILETNLDNLTDRVDNLNDHKHFDDVIRWYYVSATATTNGNGDRSTPFNNINSALELMNKQHNSISICLLTPGVYEVLPNKSRVVFSGGAIHIYGGDAGVSPKVPGDETRIFVSWPSDTTFYSMHTNFQNFTSIFRNDGTWHFDGCMNFWINHRDNSEICQVWNGGGDYEDCAYNRFNANGSTNYFHGDLTIANTLNNKPGINVNRGGVCIVPSVRFLALDSAGTGDDSCAILVNAGKCIIAGDPSFDSGNKYKYGIRTMYGELWIGRSRLSSYESHSISGNSFEGPTLTVIGKTELEGTNHINGNTFVD